MAAKLTFLTTAARKAIPAVLLLALLAAGVAALLFFWNELLKPDEFGAASLPLVAFVAGVAATFNPCGLPALPGFLTFTGASDEAPGLGRRSGLSLGASLGAMSVVIVFGVIVAFAGAGSKGLIAPYFRWVQLGVGLALIGLAAVHLMGQTERLPLVGRIMAVGSHVWDGAMGRPTPRGSYLFGAGFVLVGAG
jgi:cytochrome c biogenesis protein CcdA